jgi:YbgC/YbaW family acyl-CoA thioester hydrolase
MLNMVHNVQYFKWFERGRLAIVEGAISVRWGVEHDLVMPVVKNTCEYLHAATYEDELVVTTKHRITPRWTGRFTFDHAISKAGNKREVCIGRSEITLVDFKTNRILKVLPNEIWSRYQALT